MAKKNEVEISEAGFYNKVDGTLVYEPHAVYGDRFVLFADFKAIYPRPTHGGWIWSESKADAEQFFSENDDASA